MNVIISRKKIRSGTGKWSGIFISQVTVFFLMAFIVWPYPIHSEDMLQQQFKRSPLLKTRAPIASVNVKNTYPHDTGAFTQGLFFHQGCFYESTGLHGKSSLSRKEVETGKSLQEIKIAEEYFGEGIALLKEKIYQLTWQNETLLIYDARSFKEIRKISYRGEGWGLTSDGKHLLKSNGSSTITFHDPDSFKVVREIRVHDSDTPVGHLNELEFIKGEIWANIFMEDLIVRISPKNGKVTGWINLSSLRSYLPRNAQVDVPNGIAYDAKRDRIFVTGKYWPKIFEIQLSK
ncbi:MAG: glutamine cyclotransferase [Syntrophaceae bacterium]|nr:MAG: glutamine cyclotransferase [Syntrophaceae bacterium]